MTIEICKAICTQKEAIHFAKFQLLSAELYCLNFILRHMWLHAYIHALYIHVAENQINVLTRQ